MTGAASKGQATGWPRFTWKMAIKMMCMHFVYMAEYGVQRILACPVRILRISMTGDRIKGATG